MKQYAPRTIGFLQALGLTIYIVFIATVVRQLGQFEAHPDPLFAIIIFLMLFVVSALISASIILGYPALLFFDHKRKEAIAIVGWSALWLILFLALLGGMVMASISQSY